MKVVLNSNYGGFKLPKEIVEKWGRDSRYDYDEEDRFDDELIAYVEQHEGKDDLVVGEIPDEATDYRLYEYDGLEWGIYVIDGLIRNII